MKKIITSQTSLNWILILVWSIIITILAIIFQDKLSHLRTLGLIGIFLTNLLGSAVPFIPMPAVVTVVTGGMIYTPFLVAVFATIGAVLGDTLSYFVGLSGRKVFLRKEYNLYRHLVIFTKKFGGMTIFLFAFIPNPIFDAVGVAAGILDYSPYKFIFFLILGRFARNLLLAFFGARF